VFRNLLSVLFAVGLFLGPTEVVFSKEFRPVVFFIACHAGACVGNYIVDDKFQRVPHSGTEDKGQDFHSITTKIVVIDPNARTEEFHHFQVVCDSGIDGPSVTSTDKVSKPDHTDSSGNGADKEGNIDDSLTTIDPAKEPNYSDVGPYALWWAVCKHQPKKYLRS